VAIFIKQLLVSLYLLFSLSLMAHTIYAPNDIPLLDNRFRIDPETEKVTFIFNHDKRYQMVVLVQPDGSKLYEKRHPTNVAWTSSATQNIVTIEKPMAGPWQAIAELDGDNRIKIMSDVQLKTNRLPLKIYTREYITTHASLYEGDKLLKDAAYLHDAKLSISVIGDSNQVMSLYQDNGQHYDQLAFDGELTTHFYADLQPGRYLINISTKNDVFMRSVNKDAIIFPMPLYYHISASEEAADHAKITFTVDSIELDPNSVSIEGIVTGNNSGLATQIIMHNVDSPPDTKRFSSLQQLSYDLYTFTGKAYATTRDGRDIELQLPKRVFELVEPFNMPETALSDALITQAEDITEAESSNLEETPASIFENLWVIIGISVTLLLIIAAVVFFLLKRKKKNQQPDEISMDELNLDELQPSPIELEDAK